MLSVCQCFRVSAREMRGAGGGPVPPLAHIRSALLRTLDRHSSSVRARPLCVCWMEGKVCLIVSIWTAVPGPALAARCRAALYFYLFICRARPSNLRTTLRRVRIPHCAMIDFQSDPPTGCRSSHRPPRVIAPLCSFSPLFPPTPTPCSSLRENE